MPNPVMHFEIAGGSDGKTLQGFYRNVFGWNINADNEYNYGMTTPEETGIGGGISATMDVPRVTIYVQVADPQAYLDKAESLGGKTLMPVTEIPGAATIAMFADPQGNVMGLLKRP
jgi:hypothetical protein